MSKGIVFIRKFKEKLICEYNRDRTEFRILYKNCSKYTGYVKKLVGEISNDLNDCKEKTGYKTYPEYYRIDHTIWSNIDKWSNGGVNYYHWDFDFAVEHENNRKDWTYELLKLSFIRADVRIVIGYMDKKKRDVEQNIISRQVQEFKYIDANGTSNDGEFYVVILNRKLTDDDDPFDMRVYKIVGKEVEKVDKVDKSKFVI